MNKIESLTQKIRDNEFTQKWGGQGWCRRWSDCVMNILEDSQEFELVEAREVEYQPGLWHTFVKAVTNDGESYLFNNNGHESKEFYIGFEDEAPVYLLNSRRDSLLMTIREQNKKYIDKKYKYC